MGFGDIFGFKKEPKLDVDDPQYIIDTLMDHPILEELKDWSTFRTKVLEISDPIKNNMAEYYLRLFFDTLNENITSAIKNYHLYLDDTSLLNNLIIDVIDNVSGIAMSNGVPPVFLDKFNHYLVAQAKILAGTFRDLDKFEYHKSTLERAAFRLDIGFMLIRCITAEVESVINGMNGTLRSALEGSVFDV